MKHIYTKIRNTLFYILTLPLGGVGGGFCLGVGGGLLLTSCSQETLTDEKVADTDSILIRMSLEPFAGEVSTRTTLEGTGFEYGDKIRFKIICPNSAYYENGERYSSYYEITNSVQPSEGTIVSAWTDGLTYGSYEGQSTTYIYTAQNTTGYRYFVVGDYRYSHPSNFFYADQSKLAQFKKSDVVWAQAVRQTGAREVHFYFQHKVAKLILTIDDSNLKKTVSDAEGNESSVADHLSVNTILTLEGMPDIDGAEIVVGDYYADESLEDYSYNYRSKASCNYENNGKVIGIEVIDETLKKARVEAMTGNPNPAGGTYNSGSYGFVPNTGTYTAYQNPSNKKQYMLYVPPCVLTDNAKIWLRDGSRRYSVTLDQKVFVEGTCYNLKVKIGSVENEPEQD